MYQSVDNIWSLLFMTGYLTQRGEPKGKPEQVEKILGDYLKKTISIRDTSVRKEMKENFYHGIREGILGMKSSWGVLSN